MMQIEGERLTREDRRELERNIKELETEIETFPTAQNVKELRRLRRLKT